MKRIICVLLIVLLAAMTACTKKTEAPAATASTAAPLPAQEETAAAEPAVTEAPAAAEETKAEEAETEGKAPEPVVYEGEIMGSYSEEAEGDSDYLLDRTQEKLVLLDEANAEYSIFTYYPNGSYNAYTTPGTYTKDGSSIVFTDVGGTDVYTFLMDGNRITDTQFSYVDLAVKQAQGTYKNADYTLVIREDGTADLSSFRGISYTGNIYELSDGTWEFIAYDESSGLSADYVIELNVDRFTMETFAHRRFSGFAGEYSMTGDLGAFVLTVDREGNASAEVNIFGRKTVANGYIYLDLDEQQIEGCTLITERGEQIYLTFGEKTGEAINYYGTLSIMLSAG